jgi:hypothetical protein
MRDIPNSLVGHEHGYPCSWPTSELGISLIDENEHDSKDLIEGIQFYSL